MGDQTPEEFALALVQRMHPKAQVRAGSPSLRWRWHSFTAHFWHRLGLHDYMPTLEYDPATDSVSVRGLVCWICHQDMGSG